VEYQDLNTIVEYKEATASDWNSLTIPIGINMLVLATDTGVFKIGDGTKTFSQLPTAFRLDMNSIITDLANKLPAVPGSSSGKILIVNEAGDGFEISDVNIATLLTEALWNDAASGYSEVGHTHDDAYATKAEVDGIVNDMYPKPLADQDTLSYIILNKLKRDDQAALDLPDSLSDEYEDTSGLDLLNSTNLSVASGILSTEGIVDLGNGPIALSDHTSCIIDNKIYIFGGKTTVPVNTLRIYNITTSSWSTGATGPSVRRASACTVLGPYMYIYGGYDDSTGRKADLWVYDTLTDTWTQLTGGPGELSRSTFTTIGDKLYLFGGYNGSDVDVLWCYTPSSDSWTPLTDGITAVSYHTAGTINGELYVYGGLSGPVEVAYIRKYNPTADTWSELGEGPGARSKHMSVVYNDTWVIYGGVTDGVYRNDTWMYDPSTNKWTQLADGPAANSLAGYILYRHRCYIYGGYNTVASLKLYRYPIRDSLYAESVSNLCENDIVLSRVYLRATANDINDNTVVEVSRDNGSSWAAVELEASPLSIGSTDELYPIIMDNGSAGTSSTGAWFASGSTGPYGASSLYSVSTDGSGDTYTYSNAIVGKLKLYAWWTYGANRHTAVPYDIYDGETLIATVAKNQRLNGSIWNYLGEYTITTSLKVVIRNVATGSDTTCADALKIVKIQTDNVSVYTGNTDFNRSFSKNQLALGTSEVFDHKGSVTTLVVDTEDIYGHVDVAISADMLGATIVTASGSVKITTILGDGTAIGSIEFIGDRKSVV